MLRFFKVIHFSLAGSSVPVSNVTLILFATWVYFPSHILSVSIMKTRPPSLNSIDWCAARQACCVEKKLKMNLWPARERPGSFLQVEKRRMIANNDRTGFIGRFVVDLKNSRTAA